MSPRQHSHALRKRSHLCRRPPPPRTPSKTLHHPSGPPGPRGCGEGTRPPTFGDPSIPRVSPLSRFHSPGARAAAPRLRSPQPVPPSPASRPRVPSAAAIPHRGRAPTPSSPPPHPVCGAGSPGSAPSRPPRAPLCAGRALRQGGGAPATRAHSPAHTSPRERQEGRREGEEAAAAESNRLLPPRPRGAASAIAESRAGTRRLGARRSPDLPKPGAGECGRPRGPGRGWALPPGARSGAAGLPRRQRRGAPGAAAPGPGTSPDWPGGGSAPSPSRGAPLPFRPAVPESIETQHPFPPRAVTTASSGPLPGGEAGAGERGTAGGSCSR